MKIETNNKRMNGHRHSLEKKVEKSDFTIFSSFIGHLFPMRIKVMVIWYFCLCVRNKLVKCELVKCTKLQGAYFFMPYKHKYHIPITDL